MIKVVKEFGVASNVYVKNTETKMEVNLGRISMKMLSILEEAGYSYSTTFSDTTSSFTMKQVWDLEVTKEIADKLVALVFTMSKPPKRNVKIKDDHKETKEPTEKKKFDALDIIFGLA